MMSFICLLLCFSYRVSNHNNPPSSQTCKTSVWTGFNLDLIHHVQCTIKRNHEGRSDLLAAKVSCMARPMVGGAPVRMTLLAARNTYIPPAIRPPPDSSRQLQQLWNRSMGPETLSPGLATLSPGLATLSPGRGTPAPPAVVSGSATVDIGPF